jgi:hypothetical protein
MLKLLLLLLWLFVCAGLQQQQQWGQLVAAKAVPSQL